MARRFNLTFSKGMTPDEDFLQWADELFSELGLSQELAQKAADKWAEYSSRRLSQMETDYQRGLESLRREWGSSFDANVAAGRGAVKALGLTEAEIGALEMATGKAFGAASILARIGKNISTPAQAGAGKLNAMSADDAKAEIAKLQADDAFQKSLRDNSNPHARQEALQRWEHLHAQALASASTATPSPSPGPTPTPSPTPAPTAGSRDAALARIEALKADQSFQEKMRDTSNPEAREAAVQEFEALHQEAYGQ